MARDFPTMPDGGALSADLPELRGAVSPGLGLIRQAADALGSRLQDLAEQAATREGGDAAAADVAAGRLSPQQAGTMFGDSYRRVAQDALGAQREAALIDGLDQAVAANPDNPAEFEKAATAFKAGFGSSGFPQVDAAIEGRYAIRLASARSQVRDGFHRKMVDTAQANFVDKTTTGLALLTRTGQTAALDANGDARMATAFHDFVAGLVADGPKEAFEVAGVKFDADPTRTGMIGLDHIASIANTARTSAIQARVLAQVDRLPSSAERAAMGDKLRERLATGDPMFLGLDPMDGQQLMGRVDALTGQAATAERSAQIAAGQKADNLLNALKYGADIDPGELIATAQASGDVGKVAEAKYRLAVGFESGATGGALDFDGDASAAGGFEAFADFFFQKETGGDPSGALVHNDNGRGPSKWGINASANPDLDIPNLTRHAAQKRLKTRYWDAIGGDRLDPALAFVAADAAAVAGPEKAKAWIAASGGDVGKFVGLQEAHYRALAAQDPKQYGDDLKGWLNRLGAASSRAARIEAMAKNEDGFTSDPLNYAMGAKNRPAIASVPVLPVEGVFDPTKAGAWGQALQQRRALGMDLARRRGVPQRMLTDAEVDFYKDRIAQDPKAGIALAAGALRTVGADGAQDLLREIGQTGGEVSAQLHIASLSLNPDSQVIARAAARGLELETQGAKPAPLKAGDDEEKWATVAQSFAPALGNNPGLLNAAVRTAQLARLADSQTGVVHSLNYYISGALGAVSRGGRNFGGVGDVNGKSVLLPAWIATDAADDALAALGKSWVAQGIGPVDKAGKAMPPRDVGRARLVLLPNGTYGLTWHDGSYLLRKDGRPFVFDLDKTRPYLAGAMPRDVVRAR